MTKEAVKARSRVADWILLSNSSPKRYLQVCVSWVRVPNPHFWQYVSKYEDHTHHYSSPAPFHNTYLTLQQETANQKPFLILLLNFFATHPVTLCGWNSDVICSSEVWKVHVLIFPPFSDIIAYTNSQYLPPIVSPCIGRTLMWFGVWKVNAHLFSPFSDIIEVGGALRLQLLSLARAECADVVCVAAAAGDVSTIISFLKKYPMEVESHVPLYHYHLCSL